MSDETENLLREIRDACQHSEAILGDIYNLLNARLPKPAENDSDEG